jgi:UDP-N-acetylmuramate dehydrogenase
MTLSWNLPTIESLGLETAFRYSVPLPTILPTLSYDEPVSLPDSDCLIAANVPLSKLTSFRVGGPAEWYVAPRTVEELRASVTWAMDYELPTTFLGAGSNLLISDEGLPGLVIGTRNLRKMIFDVDRGRVTVGAGEKVPKLARELAKLGWSGLEWSVGIPAMVGGAVVMNAGAHTGCVADALVEVKVLNPQGRLETLTPQQLGYRYRTSNLQKGGYFVVEATFQLEPGHDPAIVQQETEHNWSLRHSTQPYDRPSCGSVFRNPTPYKAGWLIEQAGLKGFQIGGAQVAERHANFILNCGGATASDIFNLICHVQDKVQQQWELNLEPEVRILGEFQAA